MSTSGDIVQIDPGKLPVFQRKLNHKWGMPADGGLEFGAEGDGFVVKLGGFGTAEEAEAGLNDFLENILRFDEEQAGAINYSIADLGGDNGWGFSMPVDGQVFGRVDTVCNTIQLPGALDAEGAERMNPEQLRRQ